MDNALNIEELTEYFRAVIPLNHPGGDRLPVDRLQTRQQGVARKCLSTWLSQFVGLITLIAAPGMMSRNVRMQNPLLGVPLGTCAL